MGVGLRVFGKALLGGLQGFHMEQQRQDAIAREAVAQEAEMALKREKAARDDELHRARLIQIAESIRQSRMKSEGEQRKVAKEGLRTTATAGLSPSQRAGLTAPATMADLQSIIQQRVQQGLVPSGPFGQQIGLPLEQTPAGPAIEALTPPVDIDTQQIREQRALNIQKLRESLKTKPGKDGKRRFKVPSMTKVRDARYEPVLTRTGRKRPGVLIDKATGEEVPMSKVRERMKAIRNAIKMVLRGERDPDDLFNPEITGLTEDEIFELKAILGVTF